VHLEQHCSVVSPRRSEPGRALQSAIQQRKSRIEPALCSGYSTKQMERLRVARMLLQMFAQESGGRPDPSAAG
jgi:hypothetical protein